MLWDCCNLYILWHIVQANHRFTTNMQRRLYGRATDIHIRPLNEEKAIQAAADLLDELFVFSASILDLRYTE